LDRIDSSILKYFLGFHRKIFWWCSINKYNIPLNIQRDSNSIREYRNKRKKETFLTLFFLNI
jgi:hypothetical protein